MPVGNMVSCNLWRSWLFSGGTRAQGLRQRLAGPRRRCALPSWSTLRDPQSSASSKTALDGERWGSGKQLRLGQLCTAMETLHTAPAQTIEAADALRW